MNEYSLNICVLSMDIFVCIQIIFLFLNFIFHLILFTFLRPKLCARVRDRAFIHALDFDPNKNTTLNVCIDTHRCVIAFSQLLYFHYYILLFWIGFMCVSLIFSHFFPCFPSFLLYLDVGMAVFVIPLRYLWEFVLYPRCFMRHVVWCEQAIWWKSAQVNEERWKKPKFGLSLPIDRTQCTWGNISVFVNSKYYLWKEKSHCSPSDQTNHTLCSI